MKLFYLIVFLFWGILNPPLCLNLKTDFSSKDSLSEVKLPPPAITGGMPLMEALKKRESSRNFTEKELPEKILSNLLWAAGGINRKESGKRTAPTANNNLSLDVLVSMKNGVFKYIPESHSLKMVLSKDIRSLTGKQDFVGIAPVNLIYVSNKSKMKAGSNYELYGEAHAGFAGQNVYLYCASEGLGTVIRANFDKESLKTIFSLDENQSIILIQTVGFIK